MADSGNLDRILAAQTKLSPYHYYSIESKRSLKVTGAVNYYKKRVSAGKQTEGDPFLYFQTYRLVGNLSDLVKFTGLPEDKILSESYDPSLPDHVAEIKQLQAEQKKASGPKKEFSLNEGEKLINNFIQKKDVKVSGPVAGVLSKTKSTNPAGKLGMQFQSLKDSFSEPMKNTKVLNISKFKAENLTGVQKQKPTNSDLGESSRVSSKTVIVISDGKRLPLKFSTTDEAKSNAYDYLTCILKPLAEQEPALHFETYDIAIHEIVQALENSIQEIKAEPKIVKKNQPQFADSGFIQQQQQMGLGDFIEPADAADGAGTIGFDDAFDIDNHVDFSFEESADF